VSTLSSSPQTLRTSKLHLAVHTRKFVVIKAKPIDNTNNTQLIEQSMLQQMRGSSFCPPACQSDASLVRPQNKSQNRPSQQPAHKSNKEGTLIYGTNTLVDQTEGTIPLIPPHNNFLHFTHALLSFLKYNLISASQWPLFLTKILSMFLAAQIPSLWLPL
jgi:hypothetical protein